MKYVALLEVKGEKLRFFGVLNGEFKSGIHDKFENVTIVKEGEMSDREILNMGVVNDGLKPITFMNWMSGYRDLDIFSDETRGNEIVATLLLAHGYYEKALKKGSDLSNVVIVKDMVGSLYDEFRKHNVRMKLFYSLDQLRDSAFEIAPELNNMFGHVVLSADTVFAMAEDLQEEIGEIVDLSL
jgi:hypothetical protein